MNKEITNPPPRRGALSTFSLPAHLCADLDWREHREYAREALGRGDLLFFELDLGFASGPLFLDDPAHFLSYTLAIEQFLKLFWEECKDRLFGLSFYRGKIDFAARLVWSGELIDHFNEGGGENKRLFCAQVFAEYLHRLASYLPDALAPFCLLDVAEESSPAYTAQLLSKERFSHLCLGVKGSQIPLSGFLWEGERLEPDPRSADAKIGVCLPPDPLCTPDVLSLLDQLFQELKEPFRIIPEALLTDEWDNLDQLIVIDRAVSSQGRRKLRGFEASGGEIRNVEVDS